MHGRKLQILTGPPPSSVAAILKAIDFLTVSPWLPRWLHDSGPFKGEVEAIRAASQPSLWNAPPLFRPRKLEILYFCTVIGLNLYLFVK
jgi:hypothetical protein